MERSRLRICLSTGVSMTAFETVRRDAVVALGALAAIRAREFSSSLAESACSKAIFCQVASSIPEDLGALEGNRRVSAANLETAFRLAFAAVGASTMLPVCRSAVL